MEIVGRVVSGAGQGAFFLQLDWVRRECIDKLGFSPYPGTLNLRIEDDAIAVLDALEPTMWMELPSPDPSFCSGRLLPVLINGISGAIVVPAEEVRIHGGNVIEIIAPCRLRRALGVQDGDRLTLMIVYPGVVGNNA